MKDQALKLRQLVAGNQQASPLLQQIKEGQGRARVIAVTSGKGGVGKTMTAVNLSLLLAESGAKVLLVDADLGLANADVMLGMESGRHIGHLLFADCLPDDVVAEGPCGIAVISGGSGLRELAEAGSADRQVLLGKLRSYYGNFDYVVVDTSPGIGSEVGDFLRDADDVLLLTTPEPTSLRDCYAALKSIVQEMPEMNVITLVNSASSAQAEQAIEALDQVVDKFLGRRIEEWYHIESDQMVARTIRNRQPLVRSYPRSPAAICLRRLCNILISRSTAAETSRRQAVHAAV